MFSERIPRKIMHVTFQWDSETNVTIALRPSDIYISYLSNHNLNHTLIYHKTPWYNCILPKISSATLDGQIMNPEITVETEMCDTHKEYSVQT